MTAINHVRNLAGGGVGAARFGRPHRRGLRGWCRSVPSTPVTVGVLQH